LIDEQLKKPDLDLAIRIETVPKTLERSASSETDNVNHAFAIEIIDRDAVPDEAILTDPMPAFDPQAVRFPAKTGR
jgi:hypothetical protein